MSRLLFPALFGTAVLTLGAGMASTTFRVAAAAPGEQQNLVAAGCPAGTLPDHGACVRLPSDDEGAPDTPSFANTHQRKSGQWETYDQIPRRPDRPADYDKYKYPIPPGMPGGHYVISGYDLDRPNEAQRRGRKLSHVGHGGVDLPQKKGTPIKLLPLEHQQGPSDVLFVGDLFGRTVITRHFVKEGGQQREYILLYGHLDAPAPGIGPGTTLNEGDLVGFVGDTSSPELVHLHLEARRVRDGVDVKKLNGHALIADHVTVVCDPRNVLPLQ